MSELLMIDGAITAGNGEPAEAVVCRPTPAPRSVSWWSLPMAGAILLHLVVLALALLAQNLAGKTEPRPEVYPVRLYNVAEVAVPVAAEPAARITQPLRRPLVVVPPATPPPAQFQEISPTAPAGPGSGEMVPTPAPVAPIPAPTTTPTVSGGNGGLAATSVNRPAPPAEATEGPVVVASALNVGARVVAVPAAAAPELTAHPLYRLNREPEYPALARRRQQEGTVLLEVVVNPEGTVGGLALQQSSGYPLLDEAALKAVKEWRFEPGRRGAVAVAMKVLVPVRFGLR